MDSPTAPVAIDVDVSAMDAAAGFNPDGSPKIDVVDLTKDTPKKDIPFYKVFRISMTGEDGKPYSGVFGCKRLDIGAVGRTGVRRAELNGGLKNVDEDTDNFHAIIAHLENALFMKPADFEPLAMYDTAIVRAVYAEVAKFELSFRRSVAKQG